MVPLLPADAAPKPAKTLNPVWDLEDKPVVMVTQFLAAVPIRLLNHPVAHVEGFRNEITSALDLLFQGL